MIPYHFRPNRGNNFKVTIMDIKVFHGRDEKKQLVAVVTVGVMEIEQALEYAFASTQNIEGSWSRGKTFEWDGQDYDNSDYNPNVKVMADLKKDLEGRLCGLRSTMIFDLLECDGVTYKVDVLGFTKLEK